MRARARISPVARIKPLASLGTIRARRGEAGVWECLDEAMSLADGTAEPFMIVAVRLARAEARWLAGTLNAARHEAELAHDASVDAWTRGAIGVWLYRTGSIRSPHDDIADPYRLQLRKDWARAAKTVGHHVSAVLTKLDVPNRRMAVPEATRLGLVGPHQGGATTGP